MQNRYIPAFTMLSAGAIVSIFCIIRKVDVLFSLKLLLAMLLLFYIVGIIARKIISKVQEEANLQYMERKREEERAALESQNEDAKAETEEESEEESQEIEG